MRLLNALTPLGFVKNTQPNLHSTLGDPRQKHAGMTRRMREYYNLLLN